MKRSPFKWTTSWTGIILSDSNLILPNTWTLTLEYDAISENMLHRDIAMQRLDYMVGEKFDTSIWTNFDNEWVHAFYKKMDTYVITLPGDPYDSLIAAATMLKAQQITEDVLDIHTCSVVSNLGYNVENIIEYDEAEYMANSIENKIFGEGPWYVRPDAGFTDLLTFDQTDEPVLIKDVNSWAQVKLNWDHYDEKENNLTPADSLNIHHQERWIPLVIKGGTDDNND
jgi:hypothetical protein